MNTVTITVHGGRRCVDCMWLITDEFGLDDWFCGPNSDKAVVALDEDGHVAGIWKYDKPYFDTIFSSGTWVAKKYRKRGLGKKLWEVGLAHEKPKYVEVHITTDKGYTLIQSLAELFPKIDWDIVEEGSRKLRRLNGKP